MLKSVKKKNQLKGEKKYWLKNEKLIKENLR